MTKHEYPVFVAWSEEDKAYLARVIDLPGCIADGATVEEAIQNARVVANEWIETARGLNRKIPPPTSVSEIESATARRDAELGKQFNAAVKIQVEKVVTELFPFLVAFIGEKLQKKDHPKVTFSRWQKRLSYGTRVAASLWSPSSKTWSIR